MKRRKFIVQSSLYTLGTLMMPKNVKSNPGTGFMHEEFNNDNPKDYSRDWFGWVNILFGS